MSRRTGKTAYRKDILRTITGSARRFFALALIAVLGTMMYSGLQASCQDLRVSAEEFFDGQKLHDIEILSTMGLTDDDVDALRKLEQVGAAEGIFRTDASVTLPARTENADTDGQPAEESRQTAAGSVKAAGGSIRAELQTITTAGIDAPYILDGRLPQTAGETAATQKFLADSGFELGDTIHVTAEDEKEDSNSDHSTEDEEDEEDDDGDDEDGDGSSYTLNVADFVIVGIVTDVTNMNNPFGPTSFRGDVDDKGKLYVTRDAVEADYWTAIPVVLKDSGELFSFSGEYKAYVRGVKDYLEDEIRAQRESARYEQLRGDALKKLADKEKEAYDELADAEKELLDGEQELKDKQEEGEQELLDGRRELDRKLADARAELEDGRRELDEKLAEGLQELADGRKELDEKLADARQELSDADWKLQQGYDQ